MVDRITPATTDADRDAASPASSARRRWPVVAEPFTQWVIEDRFTAGRPPLEDVGVQLVDDVAPYELMKLRLLNASHQAMCYLGCSRARRRARGLSPTRCSPTSSPVHGHEARPTLGRCPGVDLDAYRDELLARFGNRAVRDTLARLGVDGSDRIPTFLLPVVRDQLAGGGEHVQGALVVAAWTRYLEGIDEAGSPISVVEPRLGELRRRGRGTEHTGRVPRPAAGLR